MRLLAILTLKDLRRRIADPAGLVLNLAIPLALAGMMALAFGGASGGPSDEQGVPVLRVIVVDLDRGPLSGIMTGASRNPEAAKHLDIRWADTREEGLRRLRDEEASAMLVIPQGFGDALLDGDKVELEVVKNPSQRFMPLVAQQGAEVLSLYISAGERLLGKDAGRLRKLLEGEGWGDSAGLALLAATVYGRLQASKDLLFPPIIEVVSSKDADNAAQGRFNMMGWMYPGLLVMGLLFTGVTQMRDLLREREAGTLRRQLAAPVGAGQFLLAKVLSVAIVVAIAQIILLGIGSLALGVRWGAPGPLAAVSALLVAAVTGFSAFLFSVVRTERQGDAFSGIVIMLMSLVGGAFVPPQVLPSWLAGVSRFTVNHWGNEALRALASGKSLDELGTEAMVLAALGLASITLAMILLRRRHLGGSL